MNKEQLKEWVKSAKFVDDDEEAVDGCDNRWSGKIYEKNGGLWRIPTLNGEPCEHFDAKIACVIRDEYRPQKVMRQSKLIEHVFYTVTT